MDPSESSTIRILCLHGWKQSAGSFRARLQPFISHFGPKVHFFFFSGLFPIPKEGDLDSIIETTADSKPQLPTQSSVKERRGISWWNVQDLLPSHPQSKENFPKKIWWRYLGWENVISYIVSAFQQSDLSDVLPIQDIRGSILTPHHYSSIIPPEQLSEIFSSTDIPPAVKNLTKIINKKQSSASETLSSSSQPINGFDHILGFSQGGLVAHVCAAIAKFCPSLFPRLTSIIVFGSFIPRDPLLQSIIKAASPNPYVCTVVHATNDSIIPFKATSQIQQYYKTSSIYSHDEEHNVPSKPLPPSFYSPFQ